MKAGANSRRAIIDGVEFNKRSNCVKDEKVDKCIYDDKDNFLGETLLWC